MAWLCHMQERNYWYIHNAPWNASLQATLLDMGYTHIDITIIYIFLPSLKTWIFIM